MNESGKCELTPQKAAKELVERSPLSQKQAAAYVYFQYDPEKKAANIFHIPKSELKSEIAEAREVAEAAKKIKKMDIEGTPLKDKVDILIGCGLLTEQQAKAFRTCEQVDIEAASEILDRSADEIRGDWRYAENRIEEAREMYGWLADN